MKVLEILSIGLILIWLSGNLHNEQHDFLQFPNTERCEENQQLPLGLRQNVDFQTSDVLYISLPIVMK